MPDVSDLVKKIDYNAKMSDIEKNYFTNFDYNKFTKKEILDSKTQEKKLVDQYDISNLV